MIDASETFKQRFEPCEGGFLLPTKEGRKFVTPEQRDLLVDRYRHAMKMTDRSGWALQIGVAAAMVGLVAILTWLEVDIESNWLIALVLLVVVVPISLRVIIRSRAYSDFQKHLLRDSPTVDDEKNSRIEYYRRLPWSFVLAIFVASALMSVQSFEASSTSLFYTICAWGTAIAAGLILVVAIVKLVVSKR